MNPDWWTPLICHSVVWSCHVPKSVFPLLLSYDIYLVRYRNSDIESPETTDVIGFSKYAGTNKAFWKNVEWGISDVSVKNLMIDSEILSWGHNNTSRRAYLMDVHENIAAVVYGRVGGVVAIYPIAALGHK